MYVLYCHVYIHYNPDVVLYCHIYIHYNLDVVIYCHIYKHYNLDVVIYCHIYIHYNLDVVLYCHIYTYIWYFEAHFNISNTWCHLNWNWPIFNHCSGIFHLLWTQVLRRSSTCCFTSDVRRVSFVLVLSIHFSITRELRERKPLLYP